MLEGKDMRTKFGYKKLAEIAFNCKGGGSKSSRRIDM